jgi:hypothetical protein
MGAPPGWSFDPSLFGFVRIITLPPHGLLGRSAQLAAAGPFLEAAWVGLTGLIVVSGILSEMGAAEPRVLPAVVPYGAQCRGRGRDLVPVGLFVKGRRVEARDAEAEE